MKKRILIVEVPDDYDIITTRVTATNRLKGFATRFHHCEVTEFTPPTDAEIADAAFTRVRQDYEEAFIEGVNYYKSLLK